MTQKPASGWVKPVEIVHLLAEHPHLRDSFPLAVVVDAAVRENA
jgi:hypothetical protein